MLKVDRDSVRKAVQRSKFPRGYPVEAIEQQLEQEILDILKRQGVKDGTFFLRDGPLKLDIYVDEKGKEHYIDVGKRSSKRINRGKNKH